MENLMEISPPYKHSSTNTLTKKRNRQNPLKLPIKPKNDTCQKFYKNPFAKKNLFSHPTE
jgi:hypothetical protein